MKFISISNGKSTIKLSEKGILLDNSLTLIPFERSYLYTYNSKENTYFNLVIQYGQFDFLSFIFYDNNSFIEQLMAEEAILKKSFEATFEEVTRNSVYLELGEHEKVSWGPVKDTGSYDVLYTLSFRKEKFPIYTKRQDIDRATVWSINEEDIDSASLEAQTKDIVPFGIWTNNQEYWRLYYKKKEITKDSRWGCQKQFLILMAVVVLYIIYWSIFGES